MPPAWNSTSAIRPSVPGRKTELGGGLREHARGHRDEQEAHPGGRRDVELPVGRRAAAPEIVVVHAGEVVVDQGVGVHGLDRRGHAGRRR